MELRRLTIGDREAITRLFLDVFTNEPWNDDWSDTDQLNAYIMDLIGDSTSLTLGYFAKDQMIGLSMGHIKHWYAGTEYYIDELCVDRHFQGKGIGSAFLKAIEAFLAENKIFRIFLQTERTVPAYRFYKQRGFIELVDHVSFVKKVEDLFVEGK
ncbi:MAG: GNAT family N-acetyltransferase [Clostridia bacterium]|nr:GNAT family N-acetyltransferase [Clostridia bacterium]